MSVADRAPAAGRRDGRPRVCCGVVKRALGRPNAAALVVFTAVDDHPAVGENLRGIEVGLVAGRHRCDRGPGARRVFPFAVRRQLVPFTGGAGERLLHYHRTVG